MLSKGPVCRSEGLRRVPRRGTDQEQLVLSTPRALGHSPAFSLGTAETSLCTFLPKVAAKEDAPR